MHLKDYIVCLTNQTKENVTTHSIILHFCKTSLYEACRNLAEVCVFLEILRLVIRLFLNFKMKS